MTTEDKYRKTFAERPCEICGRYDGTTVPAHINMGHGRGQKSIGAIIAACGPCHALIDDAGKMPGLSAEEHQRERLRAFKRALNRLAVDRFERWREDNV